MQRHSHNPNLSLHTDTQYAGMPVLTSPGPLIAQYLSRIHQVTDLALTQHPRTFAFRLDLRFPQNYVGTAMESNQILERFIASLKAKLRHNRDKARQVNPHAHGTVLRYVWCREHGENGNGAPHYHLVLFLNNDAFCTLGQFQSGRDNLFNRLQEAWASALGMAVQDMSGLVELPQGAQWRLQSNDPSVMQDFFYRVSYLAKAQTKHYHCGIHAFGYSRG
jgi:hypothetical protein